MSDSQYFRDQPTVASSPVEIDVVLPDLAFRLTTDRGVFARGSLDTGTKLLLTEAPRLPDTGTFLDLGCGAGAIAITMALRAPRATVWAVDVNERARHLTTSNAATAGAPNVHVASPEIVPADVKFDVLWSNPPIRIGKEALHDLLQRWLGRMSTDGIAVLVVQKHLGADSLAEWIEQQGYRVERIRSRVGYRLLTVHHRERT